MILAAAALFAACQESLEERAAREAREKTETQCPMPVGENIMLDSVTFDIPAHIQTQYFCVFGSLDDESLFAQTDTRSLLLGELKNTPGYRQLMERGVSFRYVYYSRNRPDHVLLDLTLTSEDYK